MENPVRRLFAKASTAMEAPWKGRAVGAEGRSRTGKAPGDRTEGAREGAWGLCQDAGCCSWQRERDMH